MFVVADEETFGVGGEGGLACAAEAEEDCGVFAFEVGVGGAVHGSYALEGEEVVHHGEHAFLHFAAVPGVDDYLFARGDVENDGCLAVEAEFLIVGEFCFRCVVDDEVGGEVGEFFGCGTDEHVGHEVCLPCHFHDEAHCHAGVGVGAAETVDNIEFLVAELVDGEGLDGLPCFFAGGFVVVFVFGGCPPHGVLGVFVENDELVFGRAAGVDACHHVHCAELGGYAFLEAFEAGSGFVLEEFVVGGVVDYLSGALDAVGFERFFNLGKAGFLDFFDFAHCLCRLWRYI